MMTILHATAFFSSLAAFALLPVRVEVTGSVLFAAAFLSLLRLDYAPRRTPRLSARRRLVARARFRAPALNVESHRLAA